MINPRVKLLLDPNYIRFSADCYQWALDAAKEYDELPEKHQRDIDAYRRGVSYIETAIELVNVEFKDVIVKESLGRLGESDLRRSWLIIHRAPAEDPLGLSYSWFITRISLYVPDRVGRVHKPLPNDLSHDGIIEFLFRQYLTWAEQNNYLAALSPKPENPAFIDEIEGLFMSTIDVLTESNPYVKQIFKDTPLEAALTTTLETEEQKITETPVHQTQSKAN